MIWLSVSPGAAGWAQTNGDQRVVDEETELWTSGAFRTPHFGSTFASSYARWAWFCSDGFGSVGQSKLSDPSGERSDSKHADRTLRGSQARGGLATRRVPASFEAQLRDRRKRASLIDLHCHLLPEVDDGAVDLKTSLAMARMSVAEGVKVIACTPHILPGVYDNTGPDIRHRVQRLQLELNATGINCRLVPGCDAHISPDLVSKLKSGRALTLNDSRYVLVEPPHHVLPPNIDRLFFDLLAAGYVPVLTHPERMSWVDRNEELLNRLVLSGVWMQMTAGAIIGGFGEKVKRQAVKMLHRAMIHIVASDAHNTANRPPVMGEAFRALGGIVGLEEARNLVETRPAAILEDRAPAFVPAPFRDFKLQDNSEETFLRRMSQFFRS
jgi:protein-tyrosine phosphatase